MKRYYLTDILGDGTEDNPFRPAIAEVAQSWVGTIPTDQDGRPTSTWALVLVAAKEHGPIKAAKGVDALPEFPLDGKVLAINAQARAALDNALAKRGIPTDVVQNKDGYREVIRALGQKLDATFNEDNFDIADV